MAATGKVPCERHAAELRDWRGQACGEAGWGPGHRLPHGVTMSLVDEEVAMIKGWCEAGRGCGPNDGAPRHCGSRDHARR